MNLDGLERLLAQAITAGDADEILRVGALMDEAEDVCRRLLNAARWYAAQGLNVFPCKAGLKVPATQHGLKDATTDDATIRAWWAALPDANIGIATGGRIDVIDIDGAVGLTTMTTDNPRPFGNLNVLGVVDTPRVPGQHLYIAHTGRGNGAGRQPGIDFRGLGGYVLAPPSRTEHGPYVWATPLHLENADA